MEKGTSTPVQANNKHNDNNNNVNGPWKSAL